LNTLEGHLAFEPAATHRFRPTLFSSRRVSMADFWNWPYEQVMSPSKS
jgi:hypothetical protein